MCRNTDQTLVVDFRQTSELNQMSHNRSHRRFHCPADAMLNSFHLHSHEFRTHSCKTGKSQGEFVYNYAVDFAPAQSADNHAVKLAESSRVRRSSTTHPLSLSKFVDIVPHLMGLVKYVGPSQRNSRELQ